MSYLYSKNLKCPVLGKLPLIHKKSLPNITYKNGILEMHNTFKKNGSCERASGIQKCEFIGGTQNEEREWKKNGEVRRTSGR